MVIYSSTPRRPAPGRPAGSAVPTDAAAREPSLRPVRTFALVALPLGWAILSIPLLLGLPVDPFVLLTVLFALLVPVLLITRREADGAEVRALLRGAVRLPRPLWWGLAAVTAIPAVTWLAAAALGGAQPLTSALVVAYLVDLVVAAVLVNVWGGDRMDRARTAPAGGALGSCSRKRGDGGTFRRDRPSARVPGPDHGGQRAAGRGRVVRHGDRVAVGSSATSTAGLPAAC